MQLSSKLDWSLANPKWAAAVNPLLANPLNNVTIIPNVSLVIGANVINHLLGQLQQGWFLVDVDGIATIYRSAPLNPTTLTLTSDAVVTVSIGVF